MSISIIYEILFLILFFTDRTNRGKLLYTILKYHTLAMLFNQYSFAFNDQMIAFSCYNDDN